MATRTLLDQDLMRKLERLTLVSRKVSSSQTKGERKSNRRGSSNDFADYRNYVPGDDMRYLDWKIYARLEKLFLKLFLDEENLQVHILVDTSTSMRFGEPEKLHYARQVAAAIGYITICKQDSVTIRAFGDGFAGTFGPKRGKGHAAAMFRFLEELPNTELTSLQKTMYNFTVGTRGKGLVVILSDFYDQEGYEQAMRYLFGREFEVVALQVLAPQEIKPELQGDLRLVDVEFQDSTDISIGRTMLQQYDRSLKAFCGGLQQYIVARGGSYLLARSDMPFDRLVLDLLVRQGVIT